MGVVPVRPEVSELGLSLTEIFSVPRMGHELENLHELQAVAFFPEGLWISLKDASIPLYSLNLGKLGNYYVAC